MEKQVYAFFPQVSPRGPAGIKYWGFAFHRFWALRAQMPYPQPHFFPHPIIGLLWVQI